MPGRREERTTVIIPVHIWGMGSDGNLFKQDVETIDITPIGCRLKGVTCSLHRGSIVGVKCGNSSARFRVVWIGEKEEAGQIGLHLLELGKYIWGTALVRTMGDAQRPAPDPNEK